MTRSKHTQGGWEAVYANHVDGPNSWTHNKPLIATHVDGIPHSVATIQTHNKTPNEVKANAWLVAQAPKMLALLKELSLAPDKHRPARLWHEVKTVIAQAENEKVFRD